MAKLQKIAGSHVMVIDQPELTGVVQRVVGNRMLVEWDHAALDNLTTEMWNHGGQEWYDAGELTVLAEPKTQLSCEIEEVDESERVVL